MQTTKPPADRVMTPRQIIEWIERETLARRQTSATDLIRAYRDATLHEPCEVYDILALAFLLPEDHPLHAPLAGQPT